MSDSVLHPAPEIPDRVSKQRRQRTNRHMAWLIFGAAWGWLMRDLTGD